MYKYLKSLTSFFLLITVGYLPQTATAQTINCDSLFSYNKFTTHEWLVKLQSKNQAILKSIDGEFSSQRKELVKDQFSKIESHFIVPEMVTDVTATNYLQKVLKSILANNPGLDAIDPAVYLSRSGVPNAYTPGYGAIFFNAGLFTKLTSEAQLAFVLCHEMAHIYLKHNEKSMEKYAANIFSKDFKKELEAIKKQQYGRGHALEELVKEVSFDNRKHSRFSEKEADAQAIAWLKNTGYQLNEAITCLALLDSIDNDHCNMQEAFQQHLNFNEYPFKPAMLSPAKRSIFGTEAFADDKESARIKDSLRTHPDCKQRMQFAEALIPAATKFTGNLFAVDENYFNLLKKQLDHELVSYTIDKENISRALFLALQQLYSGNKNAWVATEISNCFHKMYQAQKSHTLGKYVDLPDTQVYSSAYNALLHFIQNASLGDYGALGYYFTNHYAPRLNGCKMYAQCLANSAANMNKTEEAQNWKNVYNQLK